MDVVGQVDRSELIGALQQKGPFTVFAPTDDAFVTLLDDTGTPIFQLRTREK